MGILGKIGRYAIKYGKKLYRGLTATDTIVLQKPNKLNSIWQSVKDAYNNSIFGPDLVVLKSSAKPNSEFILNGGKSLGVAKPVIKPINVIERQIPKAPKPFQIVENTELDNIIDKCIGRCANGSRLAAILSDCKPKIQLIEDKKVRAFIQNELLAISNEKSRWGSIGRAEKLERLVDSINQFNEHYSAFRWSKYAKEDSSITKLSKDLRKKGIDIADVMNKDKRLPEELLANHATIRDDLANEARLFGIRKYMCEFPNSEMSNHLYNEYYLKLLPERMSLNPKAAREVVAELKALDKKYGVKVIIPSGEVKLKDFYESMDFIEQELEQWHKWSGGKAKFPPVLNFSGVSELDLYNRGFCEWGYNGAIRYPQMTKQRLERSLRHELTHANDLKHGNNIPEKYNLDEIFPQKVKTKANGEPVLDSKGVKVMELDYAKCKYVEDFKRIGITSESSIRYAHTNTKEFIAVASQGDLSKCTPEFKQVLIDFGMPEWRFNAYSAAA